MHAHTQSQLSSPTTGTIPSYTRTMHAHTLNQLIIHRRSSKSETSSPVGEHHALIPQKLSHELTRLRLDEEVPAPYNTPEVKVEVQNDTVYGSTMRKRSVTMPIVVTTGLLKARDFA